MSSTDKDWRPAEMKHLATQLERYASEHIEETPYGPAVNFLLVAAAEALSQAAERLASVPKKVS